MIWYQKDYRAGGLYEAFSNISVILKSDIFSCSKEGLHDDGKKVDNAVLLLTLQRLCCSVALPPMVLSISAPDSLVVNPGGFIWKHGIGKDAMYCMCRKTATGWLLEVGGKGADSAVDFGWQKLSNKHPLVDTTIIVGPSRHLNLFRND